MRILDRYETQQLAPVSIWCLLVFVSITILIDLFEHLDEILRYAIPASVVGRYYLNLAPMVLVQACPLALLLSTAFVATRLVRHQELLAMNAGGQSRLRASVPFLFVGWLVAVGVFLLNDRVVPRAAATYERLRQEVFRSQSQPQSMENLAALDNANRLYHARLFDPKTGEFDDLTVLEQDSANRPRKTINARRARWSEAGWLLFEGTVSRMEPTGKLQGRPEPFTERAFDFPITGSSLRQPDTEIEALSFSQLRRLIERLRSAGMTNVRRYTIELASRVTLPLMNVVVCLIGFVAATTPTSRGRLQELGLSLLLGIAYYILVAALKGMGKEGLMPVVVAVWAPHLIALGLCWRALWQRD